MIRSRFALSVIASSSLSLLLAFTACNDSDSDETPSKDAGNDVTSDAETPSDAGGDVTNDGAPPSDAADDAPHVTCAAPTHGPTHHTGDVVGEQVWAADAGPHIVDQDVNVRNGAKLTIEPCAEVQLAAGKHLRVAYPGTPGTGTLIAEGSAEKPIRFSGLAGARWASVYVSAIGTARFSYVTFENGGGGDFQHNATIDVLGDSTLPADSMLFVDHVTIRKSLGTGIWLQGGATFAPGSRDLVITESGSAGATSSPYPLELEEHAIDALPTGSYTGNLKDEILLTTKGYGIAGGGLTLDATLHDRGVPYHVGRSTGDSFIVGRADEGAVATLTIEAGVVMKFSPEGALTVQATSSGPKGAVIALGTAAKPIVFTSAADAPAADDWRGLRFYGNALATNRLDHVRIEYAGAWCSCVLSTCSNLATQDGAVVFFGQAPSAFITNSVFANIDGNAITEGFDGNFVDFRPTNEFLGVSNCVQTRPRASTCPDPRPVCD